MTNEATIARDVRELLDRALIEEVIHQWAASMDVQDWDLMNDAFADEIVVDHTEERYGQGRVIEVQRGRAEVIPVMVAGVSRHFVSHHIVTNHRIKVEGDSGRAVSYLHSVHTDEPDRPDQHEDHGAWYLFRFVRAGDRWRISYIKHTSLWNASGMKPRGPVTKTDIEEMRAFLR